METLEQIKKQRQSIARDENSLALAKLKKRKAETRRKIELGGLVVKAGMDIHSKSIVYGALEYTFSLIKTDENYKKLFLSMGETEFLKSS